MLCGLKKPNITLYLDASIPRGSALWRVIFRAKDDPHRHHYIYEPP